MPPMIKAEWADALEPGIREWFSVGYANRPSLIPTLFNVLSSESDSEYFHSFGSISPTAWDDLKNSGKVASVGFDNGFKTTFQHTTFAVELPVQRELIEDNKYAQAADYAGQLGDSAALKRELDAASVFNACTTGVGGDGVPLCSDSHPLGPNKTGVQDNLDSLVLSSANLETVRLKMMAVTDDVGELAGVIPDLLLVPPALESTAKIITQSPGKPGVADNDINPLQGQFRYLVWPYLTSATQWFLIDSIKMRQSLIWFDRVPINITRKNQDETLFATWVGRMRYSYGWRDWRWVNRGNA